MSAPDPTALLKRHFGHATFRPMQEAIIADALAGRDVFVVMPTGGGKSLCYQLPALASPGTTVVVSPLIALMQNQVEALLANGIRAALINSTLSPQEQAERTEQAIAGAFDLLYLAPERLMSGQGRYLLSRLNVSRFAIDEAHCISEWGHDFRPEYRMMGELRSNFGGRFAQTPLIALTATATHRVADDIVSQLQLRDPAIHRGGFERPNLHYEVRRKHQSMRQVLDYLQAHPEADGIVYCQSRAKVDAVAAKLQQTGIAALPYHAGLDAEVRSANQHAFIYGQARVIVATIAFGMGVDKPDVRFVIHTDLPRHLEGYYQETGRAGRDGLPAHCLLLYSGGDRAKVEFFIEQKESEEEKKHARWQLEQVVKFAHATGCRMPPMLGYFGQAHPGQCGHCDNCTQPPILVDATEAARKLLSAIARTGQRFGLSHVINVLRGSTAQKISQYGHETLSVYGLGRDQPTGYWRELAETLIELGHLQLSADEYRTATFTASGRSVLRGEEPVQLRQSRAAAPGKGRDRRASSSRERVPPVAAADLSTEDLALFEQLRELRRQIAQTQGVPPYIVFGDTALRQMAARRPQTEQAFLNIAGVGQSKLERYGPAFMQAIAEAGA